MSYQLPKTHTDAFTEGCTARAVSQLQQSRNSGMEKRAGRCSNPLQCLWATLRQVDTENGRRQGYPPCWLELTAKESRRPVASPMNDTQFCSERLERDQCDTIFSDLLFR